MAEVILYWRPQGLGYEIPGLMRAGRANQLVETENPEILELLAKGDEVILVGKGMEDRAGTTEQVPIMSGPHQCDSVVGYRTRHYLPAYRYSYEPARGRRE